MSQSYFAPPRPRIFAHRGAAGTCPENTLLSFEAAHRVGCQYLETDVHISKDGVAIAIHDASTLRTCGNERLIAEMTLSEIKSLDAGYYFRSPEGAYPFRDKNIQIPTLEEALTALPNAFFNIEIKTKGAEAPAVTLIRRLKAEKRVLLTAEKQPIMDAIRATCGEIPTGFTHPEIFQFMEWIKGGSKAPFKAAGLAMQVPEFYGELRIVVPAMIQACHKLGAEMHVWTINDVSKTKELLALGVDGIMTDFPERLLSERLSVSGA